MPFLERFRTDQVVVGSYLHGPGEQAASVECWEQPCIAFTTFGSWTVRASRGGGEVSPNVVLVGGAGATHDCRHPHGLDDRLLCLLYRHDVEIGAALLVPQGKALQRLRHSLVAQLRGGEPDHDAIDALSLALLERTRSPVAGTFVSARSKDLVARLRAEADARFSDPALDLVGAAAALGLSRTRFVHLFHQVVGVSPHRYLTERRVTRAARNLIETGAPVIQVCFDSGFASLGRFNAAFADVYHMTPTAYRTRFA
ncbi:MAG: AraC family transcriptional regulator [Acidimicrobiales bacterium]